jgi:hypothetical protein
MAVRNRTARKGRAKNPRARLDDLLGRFSDARCVLECAVRSPEEWHDPATAVGDEAVCLRHGLDLIGTVYDEPDLAIGALDG